LNPYDLKYHSSHIVAELNGQQYKNLDGVWQPILKGKECCLLMMMQTCSNDKIRRRGRKVRNKNDPEKWNRIVPYSFSY
jgi:hypothetical protein